jgi:hypothetical protein
MDNVAAGQGAIVESLDNVAAGIQEINSVQATQQTMADRISEVSTIAQGKFPFSLGQMFTVNVPSSGGYSFTPLVLAGHAIEINPMNTPLAGFFQTAREVLVWFLWVGTLYAILKKVMEM